MNNWSLKADDSCRGSSKRRGCAPRPLSSGNVTCRVPLFNPTNLRGCRRRSYASSAVPFPFPAFLTLLYWGGGGCDGWDDQSGNKEPRYETNNCRDAAEIKQIYKKQDVSLYTLGLSFIPRRRRVVSSFAVLKLFVISSFPRLTLFFFLNDLLLHRSIN